MDSGQLLGELNPSSSVIGVTMIVLGVLDFALVIWAIIDCSRRRFESDSMKLAWILVCALLSLPGILAYFFVGRRQSQPQQPL